MKIQILYIDDCPSWQDGRKNLELALREEGIAADIEMCKVENDDEATRLKFPGSPTFRVNGKDLWPDERVKYYLSCRVYSTPEGLRGFPTVPMLRDRLRKFTPL